VTLGRISQFFQRESTGVHQAAFLLGSATLLTKILALLRDRLLASAFGAGETLDIYYASFRLPDLLFTIFLFLAASTALIPILFREEKKGQEDSRIFIGNIASWFLVLMAAASIILFFLMPSLTKIISPGFSPENQQQLVVLTRILILQVLFLGISNIVSSVIQAYRRFLIYALSPLLYNLGIIFGILFLYPKMGTPGLAIGAVIGAFLHFSVQLPSLFSLGFRPYFSLKITPAIKETVRLSAPRTLGLSLNQLTFIAITAIASTLGAGSIAIFNLAYNLQGVPLSVIGVSYSVAAFPFLARANGKEHNNEFITYIYGALRHILFWALPATALMIVLRAQIVRVILGSGNFGWADTRLTAAALAIFSASLFAQSLILLYSRSFYAAGKTVAPVIINALGTIFIISSSFLLLSIFDASEGFKIWFENILRVTDVKTTKILLLTTSFSLGSLLNLALLAFIFHKIWGTIKNGAFRDSILQIIFASVVTGVISYFALRILDNIFDINTFVGISAQGLISALAGLGAGGVLLLLLKNKEIYEVKSALLRQFWKTPVVATEPPVGTDL